MTVASGRGVTAVLGPTNTGKTHIAIERMIAHKSGVIGLPLRLLAREVYQRIANKIGAANVALITGEEKITPDSARFQVCTVEAMPEKTHAEFVAIDEVQLATDLERGHVFTDRILNLRGRHETMLLGAETMAPALRDLLPGLDLVTRPRMSVLQYSGSRKITRMPARSAIVAFSADEVYAIAELVRRERGGAAVVMGSLSPRTRNAQVALYQSGDVDIIVATDAIGMGLNLDINHVAFAQDAKFDGFQHRKLTAAELAQVAGRAGRHTQDGTFGVTSRVNPFGDELVEALETHIFEPAKVLTWRNRDLDFQSIQSLKKSLEKPAGHPRLMKAPPTTDIMALDALSRDPEIADIATDPDQVKLLWEVARTPDYRRISPAAHAEILSRVYLDLCQYGKIDEEWFGAQVALTDHTDGEIDALSARIANVRTWTYLSNRKDWLENATIWQEKTRGVEDRLSDALHETLTRRFIDRRTSVLMKRLKENRMLEAEISDEGAVMVEGHHVGHLRGFRFEADGAGNGKDTKAMNAAAAKALSAEIESRAEKLAASPNSDIVLGEDGTFRWLGEAVAKLASGESVLKPRIIPLADEHLTGPALERVSSRLERWIANHVNTLLKPLADLAANETLPAAAKGIAYRIVENLGVLPRRDVANELKSLDQDMRASMRRHGVRFGAYHVFIPSLLKPAPTSLICQLWGVANDRADNPGLSAIPQLSAAGRTSVEVNPEYDREFYRLSGFLILGNKAVRIDILERLADLIRPTTSWNPENPDTKPEGAIDGKAFYVTPGMMSILGATHDDMAVVLKELGYREEKRLEAEIKPALEEPSNAAQPQTAEPEPETQTETEKPVAPVEPTADAPEVNAEAEEPKMISIWRYGRNERSGNQGNKKPAHARNPKKPGKDKPNRQNHNAKRGGKPEKAPDPDSPFAKLAALKKELTGKDG